MNININRERLVAFTDAIIAIAATIMVLELVSPEDVSLYGLLSQWPVFIAYLNSFAIALVVSFFKPAICLIIILAVVIVLTIQVFSIIRREKKTKN